MNPIVYIYIYYTREIATYLPIVQLPVVTMEHRVGLWVCGCCFTTHQRDSGEDRYLYVWIYTCANMISTMYTYKNMQIHVYKCMYIHMHAYSYTKINTWNPHDPGFALLSLHPIQNNDNNNHDNNSGSFGVPVRNVEGYVQTK